VEDLTQFALELFRVARKGCSVFVTDMHPETAARLGWKRGFHAPAGAGQVRSMKRTMPEILRAFLEAGFAVRAMLEPGFGDAERLIFAAQNKLERLNEASGLPAIYLLHLHKSETPSVQPAEKQRALRLDGPRYALGPRETGSGPVHIRDGRIASLGTEVLRAQHEMSVGARVDLRGYLILPGLVNAHDHLEFALFPRLGNGPYQNARQWADDIQANEAATIATHRAVPKQTRLWWGGVRNLLCGVTTVCHHNPMDAVLLSDAYPVRVLSRFGWEHSLGLAHDIPSSLKQTHEDAPFILHACEGVDAEAARELWELDKLGALEERSVLVHALALDSAGAALVNERGAAVIICPSSNDFLFGKVPSGQRLGILGRLALGSDSPLTACGDLLDEIRFTAKSCGISMQHLYALVTHASASILRLQDGEGTLRPAARADLIAVRDRMGDPAEVLGALTWREVELVLRGGRVQLASQEIFDRLSASDREGLSPLMVEGVVRWLRAPIADMLRAAEAVLGEGAVRLGRLSVRRVVEATPPTGKIEIGRQTGSAETAQMSSRSSANAR
jgi:cytosine/adenosine deaminase-related metal-dependent hydrolase